MHHLASSMATGIYQAHSGSLYAVIIEYLIPPELSELIVAARHPVVANSYPTARIGVSVKYSESKRGDAGEIAHVKKEGSETLRPYDEVYEELAPKTYIFDPFNENAGSQLKKAITLIRRYKSLLLWLQLTINTSSDNANKQADKRILDGFVYDLLKVGEPYQQPNILIGVKNSLNFNKRQKNSSQLNVQTLIKRLFEKNCITQDQKSQFENFYIQLEKIFKNNPQQTVCSKNDNDNNASQKNACVCALIKTKAYLDLIERIEAIEKRVDVEKEDKNNKNNLSKAEGILALEEAIEQASLEQDNAVAYEKISLAIQNNQAAISAYAGWFSEEFFYFFTHNKSTSGGLLKEISANLDKTFPEAAKITQSERSQNSF